MNLLYVAINDTLYAHYAGGEAYPDTNYSFPDKPDNVPDHTGAIDANARAAIKTTHAMAQKRRNDVINMNTALIPVAFKQSYEQIRMENPNSVFREMITWFVTKYGRMSAEDRAALATRLVASLTAPRSKKSPTWKPEENPMPEARNFTKEELASWARLAKVPSISGLGYEDAAE